MSTNSHGSTTRVPRALRFQILRRDNHSCRYCGATAPDVKLTVDHVVAVALGGTNDPGNLVAACQPCNSGKAATPADATLVADVSADALRWARARLVAADLLRDERADLEENAYRVMQMWRICVIDIHDSDTELQYAPWGGVASICTWLERGLSVADMHGIIEGPVSARAEWLISKGSPPWNYFAGCCWKRIKEVDDRAQEIIRSGRAR